MKLIIDIPKERFEGIRWAYKGSTQCDYLYRIVANGTPLDDVKAEIMQLDYELESFYVLDFVFGRINGREESEETE